MKNYYTERNYELTDNIQNFYKTERLKPNNLFRSFLIKENADNSTKYFRFKKKEILPEYTNIRKKIKYQIKEIKSYYNIKGTVFKEIRAKDITSYSKFAKDMKLFFFGPKGMITKKNPQLKKYYYSKEKKKIGLDTKIYAGRWEYFEENTSSKFNRYLNRLKSNKKKLLKISTHFTTEDDVSHRIHDLYLKQKKIDEKKKKKEEKKKESIKKILQRNKRRFTMNNDINKINIFNKNIFEYTSLDPYNRVNSFGNINNTNTFNIKNKRRSSLPNILQYKDKDNLSIKTTTENKSNNNINNNKSLIDIKLKKCNLQKIKNVFKKDKLEKRINMENRKQFKKIKNSINTKLNLIIEPSKNLLKNMNEIKKNNQINNNYGDDKNKYKEDIKVIVEDDKKDNDNNMNEFVKNNYKKQIIKKKSNTPVKIHFSYYDKSKLNIHNSIKDFIRNITRKKEEERELKYHKNIRDQFYNNCKFIEQLGVNLDNLKSKSKL